MQRHRELLERLGLRFGEDDPGARRLASIFEHLAGWHEPTLSLRHYLEHVSTLVALSPLGPRGRGVQLTDWSRVEELELETLFAVGLSEEWLPAPTRPHPLGDETRRLLGQPSADEERELQWRRFLRSLCARRVVLSRTVEDQGVPVLPSPFWTALVEAARGEDELVVSTVAVDSYEPRIYSEREWQSYLWQRRMSAPAELAAREAIANGMPEVQAASFANKGIFGGRLSSLSPTALLETRFGPERSFAPTELERYGRCPFQYFMGHVLSLESPAAETPDLDGRDRGTLVHEALRRFHQRFEPAIRPENAAEARAAMAAVIDELRADFATHLWAVQDQRRLEAVLQRFVELECETSAHAAAPTMIERSARMQLGPGCTMKARIDRVDRDDEGFLVVYDYKTGRAPVKTREALERRLDEGTSLQLMLYLGALREELNAPLAGCGYVLLPNERGVEKSIVCGLRERGGRSFDASVLKPRAEVEAEALDELVERARATAFSFTERIRRGDYPVRPADESNCSHCDFRTICRVDEQQNDGELDVERLPEPSRAISRLFLRPISGLSVRSGGAAPLEPAPPTSDAGGQRQAPTANASAPIQLSPAQEAACDTTRHVVLTAPAGSGKTAVLVERYLRLVGRGVPPESILALTFTRKAAREMKERLLAKASNDPRAASLPERSPSLRIGTLHSFCTDLLRRHARELRIPPAFEVLDETRGKIELTLRLTSFVDRIAGADEGEPGFEALATLSSGFTRRALIALLRDAYQQRSSLRAHLERGAGHDAESYAELWRGALGREIDARLAPLLTASTVDQLGRLDREARAFPEIFGRNGPASELPFDALAAGERPLEERLGALRSALALVTTHDRDTKKRRLKRGFGGRACAAKERIVALAEQLAGPLIGIDDALDGLAFGEHDPQALALTPSFVSLFALVASEIDDWKRQLGLVDFVDLEHYTVELLHDPLVRHDLHRATSHLLVDEYQDTSDLQWELVRLLTEEWFAGEGAPVPGPLAPTLFIVGDRNQSIYGFRDANVELLDQTRDYLLERSERVATPRSEANYRSARALIEAVNAFSAGHFDDAAAETRRDAAGRVELYLYPETDRPWEAAFVADQIADELSRTPAEEIAVLVRTRSQLGPILTALRAREIPVRVFKDPAFFWKSEILDLYGLLRLLLDPHDDRALVRVLRSPLFGFSDLDLTYVALGPTRDDRQLHLDFLESSGAPLVPTLRDDSILAGLQRMQQKSEGRRRRRRESIEIPPSLLARARETLATLERWWAEFAGESPARFLRRAWLERGGEALYGFRGSAQAIANVDKLFDLIAQLETQHGPSFAAVASYLESAYEQEIDEQEADPLDKKPGVQLLTVHAAKGLEFRTVVLPGVHREIRPKHVALQHGSVGGTPLLALKETDVENGPHKTLRDLQQKRELAEEARLLYVAMTRARDRLLICGSERAPTSWARMLIEAYGLDGPAEEPGETRELSFPGGTAIIGPLPKPSSEQRFAGLSFRPYQAPEILRVEPLRGRDSETLAITRQARETEGRPRYLHGVPRQPSAADRGVVLHRALQWLADSRRAEIDALERQLPRFVDEAEIFDPSSREAVTRFTLETTARLLADTRIAALLISDEEAYNELEFRLREDGAARVGIIDRLILHGAGQATILDYKTSQFESQDAHALAETLEQRRELYRPQLELYQRATQALFGVTSVEAYLLFTELPRLVRVA